MQERFDQAATVEDLEHRGLETVPRVSSCGASLRSTMRGLTPWRRSSQAANNPAGPDPTIRTIGEQLGSPIVTELEQVTLPR
jgi:hypothetical protein